MVGLWAVEIPEAAACAGFVGLWRPKFVAHFTPAWRWVGGMAVETLESRLRDRRGESRDDYGFETRVFPNCRVTARLKRRSRRVMESSGMSRNPADDFDHPNMPEGIRCGHVLYRKKAA